MKGFNQCSNGHFYKDNLTECPYCPGTNAQSRKNATSGLDKTIFEDSSADNDKTIFEDMELEKTMVMGEVPNPASPKKGYVSEEMDLSKTHILIPQNTSQGENTNTEKARSTKKIVGWLVSYTIDAMGRDFKLYEGRNTVGKGLDNSIMITNDPAISSNHLIILYHNSNYYLSDEMSGNGTKINDAFIRPKNAIDLKDGDIIEIGSTVLKFRSSF